MARGPARPTSARARPATSAASIALPARVTSRLRAAQRPAHVASPPPLPPRRHPCYGQRRHLSSGRRGGVGGGVAVSWLVSPL